MLCHHLNSREVVSTNLDNIALMHQGHLPNALNRAAVIGAQLPHLCRN